MRKRIYAHFRGGKLLKGVVTEEIAARVSIYRSFFKKNDKEDLGYGTFECKLPNFGSDKNRRDGLYVRATKEDVKYGYYDEEGWYEISVFVGPHRQEDYQVQFDDMIPYLINDNNRPRNNIIDGIEPEDRPYLREHIEDEDN